MAMPQCCYLAKGAKRPSHTTYTIKFDRIPFDPCNSIKRFDLSPFDQKNSTYLQPPKGRSKDTLKKWGVITDNKCACGEVQTMEHIVRSSGLTMDQLFEATPEAVQLAEKWQATL